MQCDQTNECIDLQKQYKYMKWYEILKMLLSKGICTLIRLKLEFWH